MKEHSYFMKLEVPVYVFRFPSMVLGSRVRILEKIGKNHWITDLKKKTILNLSWKINIHQISSKNLVSVKLLTDSWQTSDIKKVEIVHRLFLVNCYLLHVLLSYAQPASSVEGLVIHRSAGEIAWQYIVMTRNNLCIISISLHDIFLVDS